VCAAETNCGGICQTAAATSFAERAFDFVVVAVADQHQRISLLGEFDRLHMDLGDQRAGGVNHAQPAGLAVLAHLRRNPMRGVDDARTLRNLVNVIHKDRAFGG